MKEKAVRVKIKKRKNRKGSGVKEYEKVEKGCPILKIITDLEMLISKNP